MAYIDLGASGRNFILEFFVDLLVIPTLPTETASVSWYTKVSSTLSYTKSIPINNWGFTL